MKVRAVGWFLALAYGIGGPVCIVLELRSHLFSERFDLPPALIFVVCVLQLLCAVGVLIPRFAASAAAGLTITTVGAIFSHLRIGSPFTTLPAIVFTVIQVWYGIANQEGR